MMFSVEKRELRPADLSTAADVSFPLWFTKVSLRTHGQGHRLQGPAAVPTEGEEPRNLRLPPC